LTVKQDIANPEDVATLVRDFYSAVYRDEVLRPLFQDVAKLDLADHLPKMNRFWGTVLLGEQSYRGNPMMVHLQLDDLQPLHECHFLRWLSLWSLTVDRLFQGPVADKAKLSARRISANIEGTLSERRQSACAS